MPLPEPVSGKRVVGLIGLLMLATIVASMIGVVWARVLESNRLSHTESDVRSIATAVESYAVDNSQYVVQRELAPIQSVAGFLQPTYIKTLPTADRWGTPLLYWSSRDSYLIVAAGRDRELALLPEEYVNLVDRNPWDAIGHLEFDMGSAEIGYHTVSDRGGYPVYPLPKRIIISSQEDLQRLLE